EAEDMHHALDHLVQLAGREKHAQLQLRMAKDAAEQSGEVRTTIAARKGGRGSLVEDRTGPQAERASGLRPREAGATGSEPGDVDTLDQKLAGHAFKPRARPRQPAGVWSPRAEARPPGVDRARRIRRCRGPPALRASRPAHPECRRARP